MPLNGAFHLDAFCREDSTVPVKQTRVIHYRTLLRHALVRTVFLYFIPLLLLTLFFHIQYTLVLRDIEARHQVSLAQHQAGMLDMFLGDRLLNLTELTDSLGFLNEPQPGELEKKLLLLRESSEAFVDLAVLDAKGVILEYTGPHPHLSHQNYRDENWFERLLAGESSHVITDVYLGFRGEPHFTMALKVEPAGQVRILRAVLSPEITLSNLPPPQSDGGRGFGKISNMGSSIWLVAGAFCFIGGVVIWRLARWVALQQHESSLVEKNLSQQLNHAARLATVGELASGIAHEINNPLAVIAEKVGLMQDHLDPRFERSLTEEKMKAHLTSIESAVYRCTDITRQLLGFVRQTSIELVPCDVPLLVDKLLGRLLGSEMEVSNIRVVKDYASNLPAVVTDPGQLQQVILNLLKNAADSISGSGTITITMREEGNLFVLKVADTGCGMTADQLEKIFMPFFTTKAPGKGTGLGLSVSFGIIEGLGGNLSVISDVAKGSEFTITLPVEN